MKVENLVRIIDADFYTGVPDSQLKSLCDYLMSTYGIDQKHHIIAANEGNCTAIAAGYYLSTGKIPVVYMQNSGEGNIINPVASLMNDKVYGIPCVFIVGWRGEPGVPDEPQHIYQGEITIELLDSMNIKSFIIDKNTTDEELGVKMREYREILKKGKQVAFIVRKGALEFEVKLDYSNEYTMLREDIIRHIVAVTGMDVIISTTGKASRELFEIRNENHQSHDLDFLTVGSMGHSSSIALGIALQKPEKKVWIIDGDGAMLMHMGSMAVIGANSPSNLVHIVINNGAHETVGGQPTVASNMDIVAIAKGCGYSMAVSVGSFEALDEALYIAKKSDKLSLIEVKCAVGARKDLGRPTLTPSEIKKGFMAVLSK